MEVNYRFISLREVTGRVSLSKTQIYRLIKNNSFPRSISLGPHRVAFLEHEIVAWMASKVAQRAPKKLSLRLATRAKSGVPVKMQERE